MPKKGKRARQKARAAKSVHKVYIIRGPSGSGKSTLASKIHDEALSNNLTAAVHSTDDYFLDEEGDYVFVPELLQVNHAKNRQAFRSSLKNGINVVIVDNTNVLKKHYSEYWLLAKEYGYDIEEKIPDTEWVWDADECQQHCHKDVELYVIQRQINQFERF